MREEAIAAARAAAELGGFELLCPRCEVMYATGTRCPDDNASLVRLVFADPLVGRELDGRFTILEKLGFGGMGAVYRARQHSVDREVAIKVIHPNLLADPAVIKRFLREARLASRLSHPNAVGVLDFGQTPEGMFYLVMELLTGRTLDQVIDHSGRFQPRQVVKIGIQICDALEAAHALSIVHRDLKPENVMVLESARDFVKVLDFGLAKSLEPDAAMDVSVSGMLQGTPQYVAPERACGEPGDERSDLYALGCMLYQLATGRLPFTAPSMHDILLKHVNEKPPAMTDVPEALAQVILRLLAKRPSDRPESAAETSAALEAVLETLPARAPTDPGLGLAAGTPASRTPAFQLVSVRTELPAPAHAAMPVPPPVTPAAASTTPGAATGTPPALSPVAARLLVDIAGSGAHVVAGADHLRHATPAELARIARSDTMVASTRTLSRLRRHPRVALSCAATVVALLGFMFTRPADGHVAPPSASAIAPLVLPTPVAAVGTQDAPELAPPLELAPAPAPTSAASVKKPAKRPVKRPAVDAGATTRPIALPF